MKKGNFLSRVWKFIKNLFKKKRVPPSTLIIKHKENGYEQLKKEKIIPEEEYDNILENKTQEVESPTEEDYSKYSNPFAVEKNLEVPAKEIIFDKKELGNQGLEENKPKKKRRTLIYKVETKEGYILFEGKNIGKFIKDNPDIKSDFSYDEAYKFASRYQGTRLFKQKYFISFKLSNKK